MQPVKIATHTVRRALPILARWCACGKQFVPQHGEDQCRDCANGLKPWSET